MLKAAMQYSLRVALASLAACASLHLSSDEAACPATPPPTAVAATRELIDDLTGRFRLTQVLTSFKIEKGGDAWQAILELKRPDSATRAEAARRSIGHMRRRDLRLVGTIQTNRWTQPAEWDDGTLLLGCRDCNDGSPDHLRIDAVSPTGFWGTWVDYQTGIVRAERNGKPLPNPAGYFCAVRVAAKEGH
jgi:hypothetical protein